MVFKLIHGIDPFELNPGALAIEDFKNLTPQQFTFVCLIADTDYDNPLKTLPEQLRREKAVKVAGYGMESDGKRFDKNARNMINGKVETVEKAIITYRDNQFDEDKAALEAVDKQIEEARKLMRSDKEAIAVKMGDPELAFKLANQAIKLGEGIAKLMATKKELKKLIQEKEPVKMNIETGTAADLDNIPDEDGEGEKMSTLDRVMSKK